MRMGDTQTEKKAKWLYNEDEDENPSKSFFFHDREWSEAMVKFLIFMCICGIFATVRPLLYCGHSPLGALM